MHIPTLKFTWYTVISISKRTSFGRMLQSIEKWCTWFVSGPIGIIQVRPSNSMLVGSWLGQVIYINPVLSCFGSQHTCQICLFIPKINLNLLYRTEISCLKLYLNLTNETICSCINTVLIILDFQYNIAQQLFSYEPISSISMQTICPAGQWWH